MFSGKKKSGRKTIREINYSWCISDNIKNFYAPRMAYFTVDSSDLNFAIIFIVFLECSNQIWLNQMLGRLYDADERVENEMGREKKKSQNPRLNCISRYLWNISWLTLIHDKCSLRMVCLVENKYMSIAIFSLSAL